MKKFLLSLAAVLGCASMSAKTVLTEVPAQFNIPEDGTVAAWAWMQADLYKGHDVIVETDTTWVVDFDYKNASEFDYMVMVLDECTAGYKFINVSGDWSQQIATVFSAGTTLAAVDLKNGDVAAIASEMAAVVIQPTSAGVMKIKEIAYVSAAEYAELKAADDAQERYMEKKADWTVELTDNDASSWETPGWFGDENLTDLYKTVVVEIGSSTAVSRICIQTLPSYTVNEFFVAPTTEPVKLAFPLSEAESGIGQIAICNRNITNFLVDSITGLLKEWTDPMTVVVNKIYYTSNEETSTYSAVEEPKGYWIDFEGKEISGDFTFNSNLEGFSLVGTNTNSKISIDASTASFGVANDTTIAGNAIEFAYCLKTGGKSGSGNKLTINVPSDGVLTIAVRSGSNSATDRNLVVKQDGQELFNEIIVEGMKVSVTNEAGETTSAYPMMHMPVKAGTVEVTYPTGALNFYAFGFGTGYYVKAEDPGTDPGENPGDDPGTQPAAGEEVTIWEGTATTSNWSAVELLTDGCPELTEKGMAVGDVVRFYISCSGTLNLQIIGGHWEKDADGNLIVLGSAWSDPCSVEYVDMNITESTYTILTTVNWWGCGLMLNAGDAVTCSKITLIKASDNAIESAVVESGSNDIYNLAGQRVNEAKGLIIRNGKLMLIK